MKAPVGCLYLCLPDSEDRALHITYTACENIWEALRDTVLVKTK